MDAARPSSASSSRSRILSEILRSPGCSRRSVATALGIVPATVGTQVKKLIDHGFVREGTPDTSGHGRPSIPLEVVPDRGYLIGVSVHHGSALITAVTIDGIIIGSRNLTFAPTTDPLDPIVEGIQQLRHELTHLPALAIGIAISGATDPQRGVVLLSVVMGWTGRAIGHELAAATGLRAYLVNDVIALATRELAFATSIADDFLLLHLDEGIGMSIVTGRRVMQGITRDSTEFGHTSLDPEGAPCGCGNKGCMQTVFGWYELDAACPGGLPPFGIDAQHPASSILQERAAIVGHGVGAVATLLGITTVRITGRTTGYWPVIAPAFLAALESSTPTLSEQMTVEVNDWDDTFPAAGAAGIALGAHVESLR
ncbi:ROK family protein [Microbacterium sp. YY-01]|uniref:ROK family protein n=1 Tax=Microbacterium sp. YY-01 TaxID=3421634 RepID=UPI003D1755A2